MATGWLADGCTAGKSPGLWLRVGVRKHAPGQCLFSGELEQDCASSRGAGPAGEGSVAEEACVKDREKEKENAKGGCLTTGV